VECAEKEGLSLGRVVVHHPSVAAACVSNVYCYTTHVAAMWLLTLFPSTVVCLQILFQDLKLTPPPGAKLCK
jgi:hypothetical protein